jgi:predicted methyltransferase
MEEAFRVLIPGGHLAVIHWNYDPATPRGPALEIRPRPEQCIEWGRKAGFTFDERERVDLKPHHYGLRFRKPGGGVRRNFPIGERGEGNDKKNGS